MFAKPLTLAAALAVALSSLAPAAAEARRWDRGYGHHDRVYRGDHYRGHHYRGHHHRGYYKPSYHARGYRCDRGTGGTIIGAIAGGLLGHEVAQGRGGRGDGTTGAIIGAGVGALAGRAIDRNC